MLYRFPMPIRNMLWHLLAWTAFACCAGGLLIVYGVLWVCKYINDEGGKPIDEDDLISF